MTITVHLFAEARRRAGAASIEVDLPPRATAGELKQAIGRACPPLVGLLPSCRLAIDADYATDETPVPPGAEVALIPPVSGGSRQAEGPR